VIGTGYLPVTIEKNILLAFPGLVLKLKTNFFNNRTSYRVAC
jgi:hypothetical protein